MGSGGGKTLDKKGGRRYAQSINRGIELYPTRREQMVNRLVSVGFFLLIVLIVVLAISFVCRECSRSSQLAETEIARVKIEEVVFAGPYVWVDTADRKVSGCHVEILRFAVMSRFQEEYLEKEYPGYEIIGHDTYYSPDGATILGWMFKLSRIP